MNLFNWLSQDEDFLDILVRSAPDAQLELSERAHIVISAGFLIFLPGLLMGLGIAVWMRRRKGTS